MLYVKYLTIDEIQTNTELPGAHIRSEIIPMANGGTDE